jgi:hypothetical protein
MTVSSTTTPVKQYSGNGATTVFSTVFTFNLAADLIVILTDADGVDTTQTITTHYTVSGGSGSNGSVTFLTAPASGYTVTIQRVTPKTQNTDYIENDSFPASAHEAALDKLTYIAQEFDDTLDRIFRVPVTSGLSAIEVPVAGDEFIKWNAAGDNVETVPLASLGAISFPSNGLLAYTGTTALTQRTITGTSNEITVTNGSGASGNPTLSLASTLDLTSKTINVTDSLFSIKDNSDATKITKFELSGITTGTTRTLTVPDASGTLALTTDITGFAPVGASYVALGTDATLTSERVLTAGSGISLTDGGAGSTVTIANTGVAGSVLQVQSTNLTTTVTSTSTSYADITGLSTTLTPANSANKVLVMVTLSLATDAANATGFRLIRTSTSIGEGAAAGSRVTAIASDYVNFANPSQQVSFHFLDSPATTSSTTYKVQWICSAAGTNYLNRSRSDTDSGAFFRTSSTITAMEIKG